MTLSCLCSDSSRIKKPEVFILPKDAKKNLTGKRSWRGASGCSVAELQLGGNHSPECNESLSWDPAGWGPEEAGQLWAVQGLLLACLKSGEGMSLTSPMQTSQALLSCKPIEPSPTTRRAPDLRWLSKLGTWWMLWRRARAVCVHPSGEPPGATPPSWPPFQQGQGQLLSKHSTT